jgi:MbtH protein
MSSSNSNPFENESGSYLVLVNDEGQHSLWPSFIEIPTGWQQTYGPDSRAECLRIVDERWTDLRPKSLIVEQQRSRA